MVRCYLGDLLLLFRGFLQAFLWLSNAFRGWLSIVSFLPFLRCLGGRSYCRRNAAGFHFFAIGIALFLSLVSNFLKTFECPFFFFLSFQFLSKRISNSASSNQPFFKLQTQNNEHNKIKNQPSKTRGSEQNKEDHQNNNNKKEDFSS